MATTLGYYLNLLFHGFCTITLVALATDQIVCNKTGILLVQVFSSLFIFSSLFNPHRLQS